MVMAIVHDVVEVVEYWPSMQNEMERTIQYWNTKFAHIPEIWSERKNLSHDEKWKYILMRLAITVSQVDWVGNVTGEQWMISGSWYGVRCGEAERTIEVEFHQIRIIRSEANVFDWYWTRIVCLGNQFEWLQLFFAEDLYIAACIEARLQRTDGGHREIANARSEKWQQQWENIIRTPIIWAAVLECKSKTYAMWFESRRQSICHWPTVRGFGHHAKHLLLVCVGWLFSEVIRGSVKLCANVAEMSRTEKEWNIW